MITLYGAAPTFDDPLGMLQACHRRIERALEVAARIAELEAQGPLDDATRGALRQTLHYFATGVPRHAADEEQSLFPRMHETPGPADPVVLEAVARLEEEHAELDALHRELDDLGSVLLESGRFETQAQRARFSETVAALQHVYAEHIRIEDEELFPRARELVTGAALDRVGTEMAARRGIDWSEQRKVVAALHDRPWVRG